MATFNNFVFNTATQTPQLLNVSLTASDNSVILDAGSPWDNLTLSVPASVFALTGAQVASLTSSPLFSNQQVYWATMSSVGWPLTASPFTDAQYKFLSGLYVGQPYLATRYVALTSYFTQLTGTTLVGNYFANNPDSEVIAVLFDSVSGAGAATVQLYLPDNVKLKVAPQYNGSVFALQFKNLASCLFTVNTASAAVQTVSAITFDNRSPNSRRRFVLEM